MEPSSQPGCSSSGWAVKLQGDMKRRGAWAGLSGTEGLEGGSHQPAPVLCSRHCWLRGFVLKNSAQQKGERVVWRQLPGQRGDEYFISYGA